jgi:hypothetical protein
MLQHVQNTKTFKDALSIFVYVAFLIRSIDPTEQFADIMSHVINVALFRHVSTIS